MNKELKYGGYTASPNDHDNLEGDLAVAMNLVPENGTVRPVLPPSEVFTLPDGFTVMCIHHTSAYKHYILKDDGGGLWWVDDADEYHAIHGDGSTPESPMYDFGEAEIYKVEPIGNTLTVLTSTGIHYILWKIDGYKYIGQHIPELEMTFSVNYEKTYESDLHTILFPYTGNDPDSYDVFLDIIKNYLDIRDSFAEMLYAGANQVVVKTGKDGLFCFPFFVRYAYRLYDGSLTMHSAPIFMLPTWDKPAYLYKRHGSHWADKEGYIDFVTKAQGFKLEYNVTDGSYLEYLEDWTDIVKSVEVFISPQFFTYKQDANSDEIIIEPIARKVDIPENEQIQRQIIDNGTFYFCKSFDIKNNFPRRGQVKPEYDITNDNIVVHEAMTDDFGSHDWLLATNSYTFNNRLNLSGVSKVLFRGFPPQCMFHPGSYSQGTEFTTCTVVVDIDGREIILRSQSGFAVYDSNMETLWFYYPHPSAKRAYVSTPNGTVMLPLKTHGTLNGAYYYYREEGIEPQSATAPQPSTDEERTVYQPNQVYTSDVDNPFYFPVKGVNTVPVRMVYGTCAAVRPVSSGQYGYADLYIFTDSGVWTAKTNERGGYDSINMATADVCINPDSITQMETSVLFTTARGIMLISGSTSQCISETIDDDGSPARGLKAITDKLAPLLGLSVDVLPFRDFLEDCRMIYDYRGQRVIVYNPACDYAYIYSLESNKWGMMASDILYSVKTYPDAMAVTRDGHLVNYSDPVEVLQGSALYGTQLLITRPLTLDQPDVPKTIRTILQRGLIRKRQGHVQSVLYGSRDLMQPWHLVMSSGDENLRGFSGTPYKWFRVALLLRLAPDESVTSCSIQFEPRYINRLR